MVRLQSGFKSQVYIVLTVYDDSTGTGGTKQTIRGSDEMFTFTGIPENKFYTLRASSTTYGETCSGPSATPVQVTADVTGAQITCSRTDGLFIKIAARSSSYRASDITVNVFVGDGAVPSTNGTPTHVIRALTPIFLFFHAFYNFDADGFFHNVAIERGQNTLQ